MADSVENDGALLAGVGGDYPDGFLQSPFKNAYRISLIPFQTQVVQNVHRPDVGHATAGHDAFVHGRPGCGKSVLNPLFAFFELGLSGPAHFDNCHAACKLGHAFLQFLFVIFRCCIFHLDLDLVHPGGNHILVALALDDGCLVFGGNHPPGLAKIFDISKVQFPPLFFGDDCATGKNRDILQHCLAAVSESGRFQCQTVDGAAHLVYDQHGQSFTVHVLADDHQVLGYLEVLLQDWHQVGDRRDFLIREQDVGVFNHGFHALRISHEIGADVAAVEVHPIDVLGLSFYSFALFHGYDTVTAHVVHNSGHHLADLGIVGGNGGDLGGLFPGVHRSGQIVQLGDDGLYAFVNAPL